MSGGGFRVPAEVEAPARVLRRAAALMRERAEEAIHDSYGDSRWRLTSDGRTVCTFDRGYVLLAVGEDGVSQADAAHIASWHPAVALAAALLLDNEASLIQSAEDRPDLHRPINIARVDLLLAFARAYLGESA